MKYALTYILVSNISCDFDIKSFCEFLDIEYDDALGYFCNDFLEIGRNEEYNQDINIMVRKTINSIIGKEKRFKDILSENDVICSLQRIVLLDVNDENIKLSLDDDIIKFLYETGIKDNLEYSIIDIKEK